MANTREIQRRIKSVKNTKKITKAMEMVASSKMRRAVNSVLATRTYSDLAWQMILNISQKTNIELHPLLAKKEKINKVAVVLFTSNRGLCGSFNQQAVKTARERIKKERNNGAEVETVVMGKKGARAMAKYGEKIAADFDKEDVLNEVAEIRPLAKMLINDYLEGKYDKVIVVYTDFVSALKQVCREKQILPIESEADEMLGQVEEKGIPSDQKPKKSQAEVEYLFEPDPKTILDDLLPRLLEVQVYQALLETNASEHSARMMAMRNASDAAGDMIDELTLTYNQARQAAITSEIAEIAGGKAALE